MELRIETTDLTFLQDLRNANIPDIEIWEPMAMAKNAVSRHDSKDAIIRAVITITISFSTSVTGGLLATWIYERYKEKSKDIPVINHQTITNQFNIENLTIIINGSKNPKKE